MKKITIILLLILCIICFIIPSHIHYWDVNKFFISDQVTVSDPHIVKEKVTETTDQGTKKYTNYYLVMTVDISPNDKTFCDELTYYDKNNKIIGHEIHTYNFARTTDYEIPSNTKKVNVKITPGDTADGKLLYEGNITKVVKNKTKIDSKTKKNEDTSSHTSTSSSSSSSSTSSPSSGYSSVFVKNVLEMYDEDGDGGLSSSEWDYWCSREGYAPMSDCDTNGDGFCSQSELATYSHDFGY